ncbi:GNAT family N-acetyltransferase [Actinopolymorpha pittospori]|uniref:GNAT superfamily N-acetyltransferase n=1 Tax=Actinopolymorpha pittospori TaxID=648752 RepID=A0A927RC81_9ACTN|nr:GNAT family N-acetyltransferase [Actinopolymorpha pittospori]MBE1610982.1 GNAT superfamily N-acetyltransferase [Actinopolymorpha pittospori]
MASVDDDFEFDDRPGRIDLDALWEFLSTQAYWGRWRTRDDVRRQLDSVWRVVGVYERASGHMVGFARAVSDGVAIAYLADVYVSPSVRGRGLGKRLVAAMIEDGPGADFRWMLHTADAHGLYAASALPRPTGISSGPAGSTASRGRPRHRDPTPSWPTADLSPVPISAVCRMVANCSRIVPDRMSRLS